jgi:hypothetical protein
MNGMGKLVAQARELPRAAVPDHSALAAHAQMQADLAALLVRCQKAEKQVKAVGVVLQKLRTKAQALPGDHAVHVMVDQMIDVLERCIA